MQLIRLIKHLLTTRASVKSYFSQSGLAAIKSAISAAENNHRGEICFAVEAALSPTQIFAGMTSRERALDVFSELRVWDTELNSGVLVYFLLADRAIEIIADRGINNKTQSEQVWQKVVTCMQDAFTAGHYEAGAINGIAAVARELIKYFPAEGENPDELPNDVVLL